MNKGLKNATKYDELYTPEYAVIPLMKYIDKDLRIICPFDTKQSSFYKVLKRHGYNVDVTHINNGNDFFLDFYDGRGRKRSFNTRVKRFTP